MKRFYLILLFFSNFGLYAAGGADNILGASSESYKDVGAYCAQCGQYYQNSTEEHALSCGHVEEDLVDLLDDAEDDMESLEDDAESFFCTEAGCASAFPSFKALEKHILKDHNDGWRHCDVCDYKTKGKHNFTEHLKIHRGEKSHECQTCGKAFTRKAHLEEHQRRHDGDKQYVCEFCNKDFVDVSALGVHKRIHTDDRPYACQYCGERFRQRNHIREHEKTHTGERSFMCTTCGSTFRRKGHLTGHKRIHTGDRPYTCRNLCGKTFNQSSSRNKHEQKNCSWR